MSTSGDILTISTTSTFRLETLHEQACLKKKKSLAAAWLQSAVVRAQVFR